MPRESKAVMFRLYSNGNSTNELNHYTGSGSLRQACRMTDKLKCCVLLLGVAIAALGLRLPRLAERPMHGDEAIHAIRVRPIA